MPAIGSVANGQEKATAPAKPAVEVDRAAAHPGDDAALLEILPGEPRQDVAALGLLVLEHAQHFDLEALRHRALEHRQPIATHTGVNLFHRNGRDFLELLWCLRSKKTGKGKKDHAGETDERAGRHPPYWKLFLRLLGPPDSVRGINELHLGPS